MVSTADTTFQDTASGELVLRIRGSSQDGRIVRLRSPKCTIGSGPTSTVRLRASGVRPVHCLIVRGRQSMVVRRWSPDTLLNGAAFTDAELSDGDRLDVGPIALEVVAAGRPREALPLSESTGAARHDLRRAETLDARAADLDARAVQLDRRAQEIEEQAQELHDLAAQLDDLASQLDDRAEELAAQAAELEAKLVLFEAEKRGGTAPPPRTAPPAEAPHFSLTRQTADFATHQAVESYARRMLARSVQNKLAVALVSLVAALVLMWFWWNDPANYVALGAALTSLAVAVFWGVEHVVLTNRAIKAAGVRSRGRP